MAFYKHVLASANGHKTNDVIGLLRRSLAVIGEMAYTIYSILGITAAVYFPVIKYYIWYRNSVLASVYTICRQSVVQASKTSKL